MEPRPHVKAVHAMPASSSHAADEAVADPMTPSTLRPEPGSARRAMPRPDPAPASRSAFLPLLLSGLALLGWLVFQATLLWRDHQALVATHAGQQQTVDNASKLRGSLDALAADTQRMADGGNANARLLVEELRKRGVTINATVAPTATPTSPTR